MTEEKKDLTPEEELKAQEAPKEEEVREKIISEYGFDEADDSDKIDKLVEKDMEHSKKLSDAIGQKIKHRDRVKELEDEHGKTPPAKTDPAKVDEGLDIDSKITESLEKRAIDNLEYPDELKDEIKNLAKLKGVTVKEILRDPYVVHQVDEYEKEQKTEEASISRKNNKAGKKVYSFENPPDVDMNTEEGRKEWDDYTEAMEKEGH